MCWEGGGGGTEGGREGDVGLIISPYSSSNLGCILKLSYWRSPCLEQLYLPGELNLYECLMTLFICNNDFCLKNLSYLVLM